ncbi:MAG: transcription antitermination protein NusB [Bacteroidales bacterium]|jgi:N utilization substance protein B
MLNRRYLRIKVFLALYAFFQSKSNDSEKAKHELLKSIEQIFDLYINLLSLFKELHSCLIRFEDDEKNKFHPNKNDLIFYNKFLSNKVLTIITENERLATVVKEKNINWQEEKELIKKIITAIKNNAEASAQLNKCKTFLEDKDFIANAYQDIITEQESLISYFEDKNLFWGNDIYLVNAIITKFLLNLNENKEENNFILPLYKDEPEDTKLVVDLFKKSIENKDKNEKIIAARAANWEIDRIALIDIILMNMAINELTDFPTIPVKVTLNEYIEISKIYSTRKSKDFINGILDKLTADLKEQGLIKKSGRGLID